MSDEHDDEQRLTARILLEAKKRRDPNYRDLVTAISKRTGREPKNIEQEIVDLAGAGA